MARAAVAAAVLTLLAGLAPYIGSTQQVPVFHAGTQTVLVDLTARDAHGNFVPDLNARDFTVFEDGKQQPITSFELEQMDKAPAPATDSAPPNASGATQAAAALGAYPNRRLIVLDLDLTTMPPEDVEASIEAARHYLDQQMQPADLVAIAVVRQSLDFNANFTSDRAALDRQLGAINPAAGSGFTGAAENALMYAPGAPSATLNLPSGPVQVLDADRSYMAIQAICRELAAIPQKKSLVYFSDGINILGQQDSLELRLAMNAAQRADVSLYTADARGLVPGMMGIQITQQESPLASLAEATGGRTFLDSNDFAPIFQAVQADTAESYLLTYESPNHSQDGAYRRIVVRASRPGLKLEYRQGYYADEDFAHLDADDRRAELMAELAADRPDTSIPVRATAAEALLPDGRYRLTLQVAFPPGAIPAGAPAVNIEGMLTKTTPQHPWSATIHAVLKPSPRPWGYTASYELPAGAYALRLAVREDRNGAMGTVRSLLQVPENMK